MLIDLPACQEEQDEVLFTGLEPAAQPAIPTASSATSKPLYTPEVIATNSWLFFTTLLCYRFKLCNFIMGCGCC